MEINAKIEGAVPLIPAFRFVFAVDWTVAGGENWAVAGRNGSGKSILADILLRRIALKQGNVEFRLRKPRPVWEAVRSIGFRDIYSVVDSREAYYQQRWNADAREATPLAGTLFTAGQLAGAGPLLERFSLLGALEKRIVSLSSGELRKLLVVRALTGDPEILVIDNPFVGLDEGSREELSLMLGGLASSGEVQFILLVADPRDIPGWIDKVLPLDRKTIGRPVDRAGFLSHGWKNVFPDPPTADLPPFEMLPGADFRVFARLEAVTVRYGGNVILNSIDWEILRGSKWALLGSNGSGKSTLLSLLYADNPQAYANRITLFDRRRGTGESIWEIKEKIGFLNSDIHSFYLKDIPAIDVVVSGFHDTVGLHCKASPAQYEAALNWLEAFGGGDTAARKFTELSFGQQRLVMLARTFVKCPLVVILDEPMHGLDLTSRLQASAVIDRYCGRPGITLIYVTHYRDEIPSCVESIKHL